MRQPCGDAVRDRRQRRGAPVVDVEVEQLAEEPLVRRREQQRVAVPGERVALAQQHRALRRRLAEIEAGVERDLVAARGRRPRRVPRGRAGTRDVADQVVVVRLGVGRRAACSRMWVATTDASWLGRDREVVGVAEPADVVADHRAGLARLVEHRGPPGVARDGDVEALAERLDRARPRGRAPRPRRPRARARPSRRRRRGCRRPVARAPRPAQSSASSSKVAPWS